MEKLIDLKKEVFVTLRQHPLLTLLSFVFSVYIVSLIALAVILTVAPQSEIGNVVESLF